MNEIATLALILDLEQTGEQDGRVTLFTRELGKVTARAKSLYKMGSKLASHVQPFMLTRVRLVEKRGMQLTDALCQKRLLHQQTEMRTAIELLGVARLINELTHPHQPDEQLWRLIIDGRLVSRELLKVLGFDPEHARCDWCHRAHPEHFLLRETTYLCTDCFVKLRSSAVSTRV